jgi:hypothetical protein
MMWAALKSNTDVIELLKKRGSDVHLCGICGETAIGFCEERDKWVCVKHKHYTAGGKTFICY